MADPVLHVSVDGIPVAGPSLPTDGRAMESGVRLSDAVGGQANRVGFTTHLAAVEAGNEIKVGLDGLTGSNLKFGGHAIAVTQIHPTAQATLYFHEITGISYEWLMNRRKVTAKFTATSATDIVQAIIDDFTDGFTATGLEAGLPTLDEITFTNEDVTTCLDRIAKRIGGHWVCDVDKDLLFGLDILTGGVADITDADLDTLISLSFTTDLSQVKTRIYVEGGGSNSGAEIAVGATVLPVLDSVWYSALGGTVAVGQQRITYAGKVAGLGGALVGTAATPSGAPTVAGAAGSGVTAGTHSYKYTYVTGAGETVPSPASAVITAGDQIAAPSSAPSGTKALGGNLSAGAYQWKVTYYDAAGGETTPSGASASVTMDDVATPTGTPAISGFTGTALDASAAYKYKYTFVGPGGVETLPLASNVWGQTTGSAGSQDLAVTKSGLSTPPAGFSRQFYRTEGGGSTYKKMLGAYEGFSAEHLGAYWVDHEADASLSATTPPGTSTAIYRQATVTLPVSTDPATVGRKLYRTTAGGSTFSLVATIANNTATSYDDNVADGSLGAAAPSANTATKGKVTVSGLSAGPSGTTSRKIYRTVAGNTGNYKLVTTIADNTTSTYLDAVADGSLGADAPSSDTSGLVQETGNVTAGSTSLAVTSTAAFESSGGWAYVGALPIRYTGKSASALTGVPSSGVGSIPTALRYGSVIVAAPMLTGIPASSTGSVLYAIPQGEPVNVLAQADDAAAQAVLAAAVGTGDGVHEEYLTDQRLSLTEAQNRAEARLEEVKDPLVTVRYRTRDQSTRAGKAVTFSLSAPIGLSGTFRIQTVSVSLVPVLPSGAVVPVYDVTASSRQFSFEQLLRLERGQA